MIDALWPDDWRPGFAGLDAEFGRLEARLIELGRDLTVDRDLNWGLVELWEVLRLKRGCRRG